MNRIKTVAASLALLLLFVAAPLALTGCSADSLAGPDQGSMQTGNDGDGASDDEHWDALD